MNTTVTVALEDDVVAYLDDILGIHGGKNPSDYVNELLRREMREKGLPRPENSPSRNQGEQPVEIPGSRF